MRQVSIVEWGQPLQVRDAPTPEPKGEEVLVQVEACGVCQSDVHIWDGYFDLGDGRAVRMADRGVGLPFTMGHEIVGRVKALGPEATGVKFRRRMAPRSPSARGTSDPEGGVS